MLRLLLLLAAFMQAYFSFIDLQLLIVAYALQNIRRRRVIAVAFFRRRRRIRRIRKRLWRLPRPVNSWFEVHYYDHALPDDYFKQQLRVRKPTFRVLLNILAPHLTRQDTAMHDCITPEKVLAIALYRQAHGNSCLYSVQQIAK